MITRTGCLAFALAIPLAASPVMAKITVHFATVFDSQGEEIQGVWLVGVDCGDGEVVQGAGVCGDSPAECAATAIAANCSTAPPPSLGGNRPFDTATFDPRLTIDRNIADGGRFSLEAGAGAFGASSLDDVDLAFQAAPRWRLWGSNSTQVSLRAPMTFRSGDALGPWDDEINLPRFLSGPASISAKQLRIGSSFVFTPGLEGSFELGRSSALSLFGGLGFRYDEGETTTIADFGQARTRDSTSPAISLGVALERRLSARTSLRWSLHGVTSFRDEVGVELEAPSPEGEGGGFFTQELFLDGGIETSVMMGLAIAWRPGGLHSPSPSAPPAAVRVPIFCVPRRSDSGPGRSCTEPGYGCLVMFPEDQWPAVRERFGDAPVLDGVAMVLLGERPELHYELRAATEVERIPIEHDLPIDPSIATALGLPGATILEGEYAIDPAIGRFGGVVFDLEVDWSPRVSSVNPFAIAGKLHNRALDEVASLPSFPDVTMEESYEIAVGVLPSMENVRLPELTEILELSEEYERLGTVTADRPFDIRIIAEDWLNKEQINSAQYRKFQELGDIIWKDETCSEDEELFLSEIVDFDLELLADTSLSSEEKAPIFYASAIASYSRAYWERVEADSGNPWREKVKQRVARRCRWNWWKADITVGTGTGLVCLEFGFPATVSWACAVVGAAVGSIAAH